MIGVYQVNSDARGGTFRKLFVTFRISEVRYAADASRFGEGEIS
jgi:hypothetical protein